MTAIESLPRARNEFTTPAALQALLKANLGYNSRQVTARKTHSNTWLQLVIRDPKVDIAKVKAFAAPFDTSRTYETDYHSGQSVDVQTTKEVDVAHAAPFIEEIKAAVAKLLATGKPVDLSTGAMLDRADFGQGDFYVRRFGQIEARGSYIRSCDVMFGEPWAIQALALQVARV